MKEEALLGHTIIGMLLLDYSAFWPSPPQRSHLPSSFVSFVAEYKPVQILSDFCGVPSLVHCSISLLYGKPPTPWKAQHASQSSLSSDRCLAIVQLPQTISQVSCEGCAHPWWFCCPLCLAGQGQAPSLQKVLVFYACTPASPAQPHHAAGGFGSFSPEGRY